jgi:hypothetical protein
VLVRSGQFVAYGSISLFSSVLRSLLYFFSVLLSLFHFAVSERRTLMPVLESTDSLTSRSVLRHRPIEDDADQQGKRLSVAAGITPVAERASRLRPKHPEEDEEVREWKRTTEDGEQARSGRASTAPRPVRTPTKNPPKTPRMKRRGILRGHPLLYLGIGMVAMLALWTLLTMAVSWWNMTWDDLHYGRPRTFQTEYVVGHNDSQGSPSHFIAVNLNGRIEIIEFPGSDASKARIYLGPQLYGPGEDLVPVTLSFVDVSGNHLPDMLVHFQNTQIVFINDHGGFRPASPDELHTVVRYLQQHGH